MLTAIDRNGNSFTYCLKDLFWNPKSHDYLKNQERIFSQYLPELIQHYPGKYIVFENGKVIDSDEEEMILLNRISENEFYDDRPAIFYKFVPRKLKVNA